MTHPDRPIRKEAPVFSTAREAARAIRVDPTITQVRVTKPQAAALEEMLPTWKIADSLHSDEYVGLERRGRLPTRASWVAARAIF